MPHVTISKVTSKAGFSCLRICLSANGRSRFLVDFNNELGNVYKKPRILICFYALSDLPEMKGKTDSKLSVKI